MYCSGLSSSWREGGTVSISLSARGVCAVTGLGGRCGGRLALEK